MSWTIRYVGVLWFIFHVHQLSLIGFTQPNPCYNSKPTMKHLQKPVCKPDWKWTIYPFYIEFRWQEFLEYKSPIPFGPIAVKPLVHPIHPGLLNGDGRAYNHKKKFRVYLLLSHFWGFHTLQLITKFTDVWQFVKTHMRFAILSIKPSPVVTNHHVIHHLHNLHPTLYKCILSSIWQQPQPLQLPFICSTC